MKQLVKYPKTFHFPFSPGTHSDDRLLKDTNHFKEMNVIYTEKMDGENTTLYHNHIHARSLDSIDHPTRHYIKGIWGSIKHLIPEGRRICGENLYAKHSIFYDNLESYFQVYSIWDERNWAYSWDDTVDICNNLGLKTVPVLYRGIYDENILKEIISKLDLEKQEGIVVRNTDTFEYKDFSLNVAKWVRAKHVQTSSHWLSQKIVPNKLK